MRRLLLLLLASALVLGAGSVSVADTWTLASSTANPNGAWTFGVYLEDSYNATVGPFYAWPTDRLWAGISSLHYYANPDDLACGAIFHNPTSTAYVSGQQWLLPGDVCLHPGTLQDWYAPVVRWTAPSDMTISIDAVFSGHDPATTGVHVVLDGDLWNGDGSGAGGLLTGTHLFDGIINGNAGCASLGIAASGTSPVQSYNGSLAIAAGHYIDFTVDPQGWFAGDMTGLAVTISTVPEPTTLGLLACALMGMVAAMWRRRK
jgi:hypothetical protein